MALVAPIMVLVMFAIVEAGWFAFSWVTVQHAARTAARFAATGRGEREGNRGQQIHAAAAEAARGLPPGRVQIRVKSWPGRNGNGEGRPDDPGGPCDLMEVQVDFNYEPIIPIADLFIPDGVVLRGRDKKLNEPWTKCP
jgi:hypothetical protein